MNLRFAYTKKNVLKEKSKDGRKCMFLEELYILEQKGDSCDEDLEIINTLGRDKTS